MSGALVLDIEAPLDRFPLQVAWRAEGARLGVFGPSGAGKTSLLEAIAGLRPAVRGRIEVDGTTWLDTARGVRLPPQARGVGYVPQDARLFPHLDVRGNLTIGKRRAERAGGRRVDPDRVLEVLELRGRETVDTAALSGGERQRVALGRALCSGPDLLLLDEPLAGLDLPLRRRILPHLLRVQREFGVPTLSVSHDATEIRALSDEIIVLEAGRVAERGPADELFRRVADRPAFRGEGFENVLRGRVVGVSEATATLECGPGLRLVVPGGDLAPGDEAIVAVRAEDLIVALETPAGLSAQNVLEATVRAVRAVAEPADDHAGVLLTMGLAGGTEMIAAITATAARRLGVKQGMRMALVFKAQACRVVAAL